MIPKKPVTISYMCTWCGATALRTSMQGRPLPGVCPRRGTTKDGRNYPHRWVINKKF